MGEPTVSSEQRRPTIGDTVRVLSDTLDKIPVGSICTIVANGNDRKCYVDYQGRKWVMLFEELELVTPKQYEFKVGDRVKIVGPMVNGKDCMNHGATGKIESMNCGDHQDQGPIKVRYGEDMGQWIGMPPESLQLLEE